MKRIEPHEIKSRKPEKAIINGKEFDVLNIYPCSVVALNDAFADFGKEQIEPNKVHCYSNGYCPLKVMNTFIKKHFLSIYKYYGKNERKPLKEFSFNKTKAIVCVQGHYIYVDGDTYYSYYDNEDDPVIAIWILIDLTKWRKEYVKETN